MGIKPTSESCPICGAEVMHLNNHIRMSAGGSHGPMAQYPDGWDMSSRSMSESSSPVVSEPGPTDPIDTEPEPDTLELTDHRADARIYSCECGEELVYHAAECPTCGEPKQWREVA